MPYTTPTMTEFKAVFPAFASVQQATYDFWVARAERTVTETWGDDRSYLTMLLTAHLLVVAGQGDGTEAQMAAAGAGSFQRLKSGSLEVDRGTVSADVQRMGIYGQSTYGRQFWPYLRAFAGGPRVSSTGTQPLGHVPW